MTMPANFRTHDPAVPGVDSHGDHMPGMAPWYRWSGLVIKSGGRVIPWKRDSVNMFAFHVDVPAGASALDIAFDFLSPPDAAGNFAAGSSATTELAVPELEPVRVVPAREWMPTSCNIKRI